MLNNNRFLHQASKLAIDPKFVKQIEQKYNWVLSSFYQANDVIHDAYLIGCERIQKGQDIPNPEAWMRKTIQNLCFQIGRKMKRQQCHVSLDSPSRDSDGSDSFSLKEKVPSEKYIASIDALIKDEENKQQLQLLQQALKELNEEERKLIKLRIIRKLSWKEIARRLDFHGNLNTLTQKGSRAGKKLRNKYEKLVAKTCN